MFGVKEVVVICVVIQSFLALSGVSATDPVRQFIQLIDVFETILI